MKSKIMLYLFLSLYRHFITCLKFDFQSSLNLNKDNHTDFTSFTWNELFSVNKGPLPRRGHSMVQIDNYLIIFGGCFMETDCYNDIHFYDIEHFQWYQVNATGQIPLPRQGHTATLFGNTMYVYGGSSGNGYSSDLYAFDIEQRHWKQLSLVGKVSAGRSGHGAAIDNEGRLIIFGGYTDKGYSNELFVMNLVTQRYEKPLTNGIPPSPRENFAFELINNRIILFGGFQEGGVLNDLYTLSLSQWTWEKLESNGPVPPALSGLASTHVGKKLYISGGCNFHQQKCFNDTYVLDLQSLWWSKLTPLGNVTYESRGEFRLSFYKGSLYLFGGCEMYHRCFNSTYMMKINVLCPDHCSLNGKCIENIGCMCSRGFYGADCSKKIRCIHDCNLMGECKLNGKCLCYPGWSGLECNINLACPRNCTDHIHGKCQGDSKCKCNKGFYGQDCSQAIPNTDYDDMITTLITKHTSLLNKNLTKKAKQSQTAIESTFLYQLIKGDTSKNCIIGLSLMLFLCAVGLYLYAVFFVQSQKFIQQTHLNIQNSEKEILN